MSEATTYFLELDVGEHYPITHRLAFETKADAIAQLDIIEPLMGHGRYRNDPEKNRLRLAGPDGELVVVMEHVRAARVTDRAAFDRLASYAHGHDKDRNEEVAERIAKTAATTFHALMQVQSQD